MTKSGRLLLLAAFTGVVVFAMNCRHNSRSTRDVQHQIALLQLVALRESRRTTLEGYFMDVRQRVKNLARSTVVRNAVMDFISAQYDVDETHANSPQGTASLSSGNEPALPECGFAAVGVFYKESTTARFNVGGST